jgi:hypothetical protein
MIFHDGFVNPSPPPAFVKEEQDIRFLLIKISIEEMISSQISGIL